MEAIDEDTSVVPASAYILNDQHQVLRREVNMNYSELADLNSYSHFRPAKDVRAVLLATRSRLLFN